MSQFKSILTGLDTFLWGRYNLETGTGIKTFRKRMISPYAPGEKMRPAYSLADTGGRRANSGASEETKDIVRRIEMTLHLRSDWSRPENYQATVDLVEDIIRNVINKTSIAAGVYRVHYIDDDPFEVLVEKGATEQIWLIIFEVETFITVNPLES